MNIPVMPRQVYDYLSGRYKFTSPYGFPDKANSMYTAMYGDVPVRIWSWYSDAHVSCWVVSIRNSNGSILYGHQPEAVKYDLSNNILYHQCRWGEIISTGHCEGYSTDDPTWGKGI